MSKRLRRSGVVLLVAAALFPAVALAGDISVRDLTTQLYHANRAKPLEFSGRDLRELDLSGLDFKAAKITNSNLFGADLSRADLSNTMLRGSRLDRVTIVGARFDGADLTDVSFLRPSTSTTLTPLPGEAPSFAGANLTRARLFGRFTRSNFHGANLEGATLAPSSPSGFIEHIWRTELLGADLSDARLKGADLTYALLRFANLRGADLAGAKLVKVDLAKADLTGADLSGADLTDADLDGAILTGTRGLDTALGLDNARNLEKAIR